MTDKQAREAFEKWASSGFEKHEFELDENGDYQHSELICAWMGWQSASQQNSGWQKISSAPKDGTEVLLYKFHYTSALDLPVYTMQVASWQSGMWYVSEAGCGDGLEVIEIKRPTHWMPLPQPPKENV